MRIVLPLYMSLVASAPLSNVMVSDPPAWAVPVWPSWKMLLEAVSLMLSMLAFGVMLPGGFVVVIVNACFGAFVKVRALSVHSS